MKLAGYGLRDTKAERSRGRALARLLAGASGAQLLELALSLPFLLVFMIGVVDFGRAFNLKQNLTNAAREGARIAVSNSLNSTTCSASTPCSIQAAADAVKQYLINAGLSASSCIAPGTPSSSSGSSWTYSCSGITLTIDRGFDFTSSSGLAVPGTKVKLDYPYTWNFNRVLGLLVKGASLSLPSTLESIAVMQTLATG